MNLFHKEHTEISKVESKQGVELKPECKTTIQYVQTRSDHSSRAYSGINFWKTVAEAYRAWETNPTIWKISWTETKTIKISVKKSGQDAINDKTITQNVRYRFITVTKRELINGWSEQSLIQIRKLFPRFDEVPIRTGFWINQDVMETVPSHPECMVIHHVLTDEQFCVKYCDHAAANRAGIKQDDFERKQENAKGYKLLQEKAAKIAKDAAAIREAKHQAFLKEAYEFELKEIKLAAALSQAVTPITSTFGAKKTYFGFAKKKTRRGHRGGKKPKGTKVPF